MNDAWLGPNCADENSQPSIVAYLKTQSVVCCSSRRTIAEVGLYGYTAGYQIAVWYIFVTNPLSRPTIKGLDIIEIDSFSILEHRNNEPIRRDHHFWPLIRTIVLHYYCSGEKHTLILCGVVIQLDWHCFFGYSAVTLFSVSVYQ